MQTFEYHLKGLKTTFEQLFKGKFLIFFVPGMALTLLYFSFTYYTSSMQSASHISSEYSWIDWIFGWINSGIDAAFSIFSFIFEQIYIFAVITLLSPFNTVLGERFDKELTGNQFESGFVRFINDFIRMVFVVFLLVAMEFGLLILYWVFSWFIPDVIDSIIYYLISAFFFGISFYDFALERYSVGVFGTITFGFSKPLTMILTGSIFLAIYNIPYIGIPLSPVIAVMVSTVVYLYITKRLPKNNTDLKPTTNE